MMTRKHFETVARVLQRHVRDDPQTVGAIADDLAETFADENPNFQKAKFMDVVLDDREART